MRVSSNVGLASGALVSFVAPSYTLYAIAVSGTPSGRDGSTCVSLDSTAGAVSTGDQATVMVVGAMGGRLPRRRI